MSDHASLICNRSEDLKLVMSKISIRESQHLHHIPWMSHWVQASSSSSSHILKHCTVSNVSNKEAFIEGQGHAPVQSTKCEDVKEVCMDMMPNHPFEQKKVWRSNPGGQDPTSHVLQLVEPAGNEIGRFKIINDSVVRKTVNSCGSEDKVSALKLPASSVNWENFTMYHYQKSQTRSSEFMHFPLFDINRKMETILGQKRKSNCGTTVVRKNEQLWQSESMLAPHLIEFASEEHQCQPHSMMQSIDQVKEPQESIRGLVAHQDVHSGTGSNAAVHKCKCQRPNMTACVCIDEENDPFSSGLAFKEHFANTNLAYLKHELRKFSCNSATMVSEMKTDKEMLVRSFGSSGPMSKDGSLQIFEDSYPCSIPHPNLAGERSRKIEDVSGSRPLRRNGAIPGVSKLNYSERIHHMSHKISNDKGETRIHGTSNTLDSRKGGAQKFSKATQCLSITKKMAIDLCHEGKMTGDLTFSANSNGKAFFKMLTLPSVPQYHGQPEENWQHHMSSSTCQDQEASDGNGTPFLEKQNEAPVKTTTIYTDVFQMPASLPGVAASKSEKDIVCSNLTRFDSTAASTTRQAININEEAQTPNRNSEHPTFGSNGDYSVCRVESMDADDVVFHVRKPENSIPNPQIETTFDSEPSNRWVKRLRRDLENFLPIGTKRIEMGDAAVGQVQNLFSRVGSYDRSISDLSKCQQSDKTNSLPKNGQSSSEESEKVIHWIRRWCRSSQEKSLPPSVLCEPENSKVLPEKYEGKQFPSIAAMAMMGKTMNNFQPCSFERRGSSIVWKS